MKILVAVKRVVDAKVKVRPLPDHSDVDTKLAKMTINPFDEIAVEAAVRAKEAGNADEVVAVTVGGGAKGVDVLRIAMAMGADRSIHVTTDRALEPLTVAKVLAKICEKEQPDVVLLGKQAIDDDAGQVGAMLSALMKAPVATSVSGITWQGQSVQVVRENDQGTQTLRLDMPAVLTADLRLAEPRYVTLPSMAKARKKPVEEVAMQDLGVVAKHGIHLKGVRVPVSARAREMLSSVDELVAKIKASVTL